MMTLSEFDRNLEKYADVIVKVGLNLQEGQRLLIGAALYARGGVPLEAAPLVRAVTAKAYQAGARYVNVIWEDEQVKLTRFRHAPRDSFDVFPTWKTELTRAYGDNGDALLIIGLGDPDLLSGQDATALSTAQQAAFKHGTDVLHLIENSVTNWCSVRAPTPGWADKVMIETTPENRMSQMWQSIFAMCRVTGHDPVADWQVHIKHLTALADYLNSRRYVALKYRAPGADLTVGLPQTHIWRSAGLNSQRGIFYTPNIPTEEVFTMPHKDQVDGIVTATKPLSVGGALIDNFTLTFEAGRVVRVTATTGEAHLNNLLNTDEGARRIGEVALVPHSSPISQSGLIFYDIVYDENASNHIALGNAYKFSLEGGTSMSPDAFAAAGGNQSQIHIDFMVGSGAMNVDGMTANGESEAIMRGGEWAFDV